MATTSKTTKGDCGTSDLTSRIRDALNRLDALNRESSEYLKALAFILHRVAMADNHLCEQEVYRMEQILVDHASLSREQAVLAVEIARHCGQIADCGCSYAASRRLRSSLDDEAGLRIHRFLESVAEADGIVRRSEAAQIRQIATELGLQS